MLKFIYILLLIAIFSCDSGNEKENKENRKRDVENTGSVYTDTLIKDIIEGQESENNDILLTNNPIKLIHYLNCSNLDSLDIYLSRYNLDTIERLGVFKGIELKSGNQWDSYISYRINEYWGDLDYHIYPSLILSSFSEFNDSTFLEIYGNESTYIMNMKYATTMGDIRAIAPPLIYIKRSIASNPQKYRYKYMLGRILSKQTHYQEAEGIFNELVSNNYYKQKCLIELSRIYSITDNKSKLSKTIKLYDRLYPNCCNIYSLNNIIHSDNDFVKACKKCIKYGTAKDKMEAKLAYAEFMLRNKQYAKIEDELSFESPVNRDSFDVRIDNKKFELYLKYYFVTNKNEELCNYILNNTGSLDSLYRIGSRKDLYGVLKRLNVEYKKYKDFDKYFERNFDNCINW